MFLMSAVFEGVLVSWDLGAILMSRVWGLLLISIFFLSMVVMLIDLKCQSLGGLW